MGKRDLVSFKGRRTTPATRDEAKLNDGVPL